jgi:hypothetical protein
MTLLSHITPLALENQDRTANSHGAESTSNTPIFLQEKL